MRILRNTLNAQSCKNNVTLSTFNVTMPYVIDDVMKIKLATKWHHASHVSSPCCDLSTDKSLNLTIGYLGEVC